MAKKSFKDLIFQYLKKDEDAPANATGTAVAGTGDDSSTVVVKKKKKLQKNLMRRMGIKEAIDRAIPDLEYPKDEIRERVNQLKELALGEKITVLYDKDYNYKRQTKVFSNKKDAEKFLPKVVSMLDRLAKKNQIHKNKAANLKGKLAKYVNSLG